jgi:hypothetical protein
MKRLLAILVFLVPALAGAERIRSPVVGTDLIETAPVEFKTNSSIEIHLDNDEDSNPPGSEDDGELTIQNGDNVVIFRFEEIADTVEGVLSLGVSPAQNSGIIRVPNDVGMCSRNNAGDGDVCFYLDSNDKWQLGADLVIGGTLSVANSITSSTGVFSILGATIYTFDAGFFIFDAAPVSIAMDHTAYGGSEFQMAATALGDHTAKIDFYIKGDSPSLLFKYMTVTGSGTGSATIDLYGDIDMSANGILADSGLDLASQGLLRMPNGASGLVPEAKLCWRNAGNTDDECVYLNSDDDFYRVLDNRY